MKYLFTLLIMGLMLLSKTVSAENINSNNTVRIKLTFENKSVIVKMQDNSAARQLISQLPSTFKFTDFAGKEKIAKSHRPISLTDVTPGMIASSGKMFIYAPWGNFGFFYQTSGYTLDRNLIELGEVESGLEYLQNQAGEFNAKIEILE